MKIAQPIKSRKARLFLFTAIAVFLITLLSVAYVLWRIQTGQYSYTYFKDGNIWVGKNQTQVQITSDASEDTIYKNIAWTVNAQSLLYLKCEPSSSLCIGIKKHLFSGQEEKIFELRSEELVKGTSPTFGGRYAWAPNGEYFIYSGKETLHLVEAGKSGKEILNWKVTNPVEGIGGPLCSKIEISPSAKYFTFCNTVATQNTIWGDVFIFDNTGKLLKKLDDSNQLPTRYNTVVFINDYQISIGDNKLMRYDIEKDELSSLVDDSASIVTLSTDRKYLICFKFAPSSYFYINISTGEVHYSKPSDLIDFSYAKQLEVWESLNVVSDKLGIFAPNYIPD